MKIAFLLSPFLFFGCSGNFKPSGTCQHVATPHEQIFRCEFENEICYAYGISGISCIKKSDQATSKDSPGSDPDPHTSVVHL
jgi:hypothetical protein